MTSYQQTQNLWLRPYPPYRLQPLNVFARLSLSESGGGGGMGLDQGQINVMAILPHELRTMENSQHHLTVHITLGLPLLGLTHIVTLTDKMHLLANMLRKGRGAQEDLHPDRKRNQSSLSSITPPLISSALPPSRARYSWGATPGGDLPLGLISDAPCSFSATFQETADLQHPDTRPTTPGVHRTPRSRSGESHPSCYVLRTPECCSIRRGNVL